MDDVEKFKIMSSNLSEKSKVASEVNYILNMNGDPLGVLSWWFSSNARMTNWQSPFNELLYGDIDKVLGAAKSIVETD